MLARAEKGEADERYLGVYVYCNWESECPLWKIGYTIRACIVHGDDVKHTDKV